MSHEVIHRLACDHDYCTRTYPIGLGQSIAEVRAEAANQGWASPKRGLDYCPSHSAPYRP